MTGPVILRSQLLETPTDERIKELLEEYLQELGPLEGNYVIPPVWLWEIVSGTHLAKMWTRPYGAWYMVVQLRDTNELARLHVGWLPEGPEARRWVRLEVLKRGFEDLHSPPRWASYAAPAGFRDWVLRGVSSGDIWLAESEFVFGDPGDILLADPPAEPERNPA